MDPNNLTYQQFVHLYSKEFPGPQLFKRAGQGWKRYQHGLRQRGGGKQKTEIEPATKVKVTSLDVLNMSKARVALGDYENKLVVYHLKELNEDKKQVNTQFISNTTDNYQNKKTTERVAVNKQWEKKFCEKKAGVRAKLSDLANRKMKNIDLINTIIIYTKQVLETLDNLTSIVNHHYGLYENDKLEKKDIDLVKSCRDIPNQMLKHLKIVTKEMINLEKKLIKKILQKVPICKNPQYILDFQKIVTRYLKAVISFCAMLNDRLLQAEPCQGILPKDNVINSDLFMDAFAEDLVLIELSTEFLCKEIKCPG